MMRMTIYHLLTTMMKMGVDPIDSFIKQPQQQQIMKLFRFGTPEEIGKFEESVVANEKSKSPDKPKFNFSLKIEIREKSQKISKENEITTAKI